MHGNFDKLLAENGTKDYQKEAVSCLSQTMTEENIEKKNPTKGNQIR